MARVQTVASLLSQRHFAQSLLVGSRPSKALSVTIGVSPYIRNGFLLGTNTQCQSRYQSRMAATRSFSSLTCSFAFSSFLRFLFAILRFHSFFLFSKARAHEAGECVLGSAIHHEKQLREKGIEKGGLEFHIVSQPSGMPLYHWCRLYSSLRPQWSRAPPERLPLPGRGR